MTVTARRSAPSSPGPPGSGTVEQVLTDYWAKRGMVSEPIPFDGRSDYVGFVNRGIPSGGVFAGAEAPKTAAAGRQVRRRPGRAARPVLPRGLRQRTRRSRASRRPTTMNVYEADPTPANLAHRPAAGRLAARQRTALAEAVQGHARARHLVLRAQSRTPSRRRRPPRRPRRPSAAPVQVPGPQARSHALSGRSAPPRRPRRGGALFDQLLAGDLLDEPHRLVDRREGADGSGDATGFSSIGRVLQDRGDGSCELIDRRGSRQVEGLALARVVGDRDPGAGASNSFTVRPLVVAEEGRTTSGAPWASAPSVLPKPPWQTITSARRATSSCGTQVSTWTFGRHLPELGDLPLGVADREQNPDRERRQSLDRRAVEGRV